MHLKKQQQKKENEAFLLLSFYLFLYFSLFAFLPFCSLFWKKVPLLALNVKGHLHELQCRVGRWILATETKEMKYSLLKIIYFARELENSRFWCWLLYCHALNLCPKLIQRCQIEPYPPHLAVFYSPGAETGFGPFVASQSNISGPVP